MLSPLIKASLQAALLNALSNILAQLIACWRANTPYTIDFSTLLAFVSFSLIASPPNYVWQAWLEAAFPGYAESLTQPEKEKLVDEVVAGQTSGAEATDATSSSTLRSRSEKELAITSDSAPLSTPAKGKPRRKLNIRNTAIKFLLDQTLGAAANTVLFLVGIAVLQGRGFEQGVVECREKFWPLIRAGQRLWPMVSIISLTVIPVEQRMVFGSIIGVGWGVFLSFFSSPKAKAE